MTTHENNKTGGDVKLNALQKELLKRWQKKHKTYITQDIKDILKIKFNGEVLFDEPMANHSYMKIGGKADAFLVPNTKEDLVFLVNLANEYSIPYYFHGGGANTLIKDGGIKGFVISVYNNFNEIEIVDKQENFIDITAQTGAHFSKLIKLCQENGIADIMPLVGIPGSIGGVLKMNAGTPLREIKDVVRELIVITKDGEEKTISREHLDFNYRSLKLSRTIFLYKVLFRFEDLVSPEEAHTLMKQHQDSRANKQPLDYPSLGSVFKNPVPQHKHEIVAPAGKLIEEAGLKNIRVGGARVSPKHANFIVNENKARAADVMALINLIKDKVKQSSDILLETEIKIIGED